MTATDTIAAVATAPGRGALGIVRVSGPAVPRLLQCVAGAAPPPREAALRTFRDIDGAALDSGLVIHFPAPASFTGEDVCEFHLHGNPHILHALLDTLRAHGARPARPGEFTERAFRNGKLDLAQAEAVADLIESGSLRAARSALRCLQGEFSRRIDDLVLALTHIRVAFEGAIDFPDDIPPEELGADEYPRLEDLRRRLTHLIASARRGARLASGITVAIIGAPNVGKSTLLNAIAGTDRAIVSATPGTTRDVIEVDTEIAGVPVRLYDTAGLRETGDEIEREGIRRATAVMARADVLLLVTDDPVPRPVTDGLAGLCATPVPTAPTLVVHNKIDLFERQPACIHGADAEHVYLAARDGQGLELLFTALTDMLRLEGAEENEFAARARHLAALEEALSEVANLTREVCCRSPELAAESLRRAADALATITGGGGSEALLGEIFARFCIGK